MRTACSGVNDLKCRDAAAELEGPPKMGDLGWPLTDALPF
jgi:hypothetical protein